ncbi:MAG: hypothetical protein P4L74_06840 [Candidatus Doudnabacteria bacterium]|nr:hypothetical protein [Candidatus Doudnabacteria bacterium]
MDNLENNNPTPQAETPASTGGLSSLASGHSRLFKFLALSLIELIVLIGVFALGINIGLHKARFTYAWINQYPKNFGGPQPAQFMPVPPGNVFFNSHGVSGQILSTNGTSSLIIKDSDNNEKTVLIGTGAVIRENFETIQPQSLKAGQEIVVIGEPNQQGQIQARFVRVIDNN